MESEEQGRNVAAPAGWVGEPFELGYPVTDLDALLNDLQGNGVLMSEDHGLARFGQDRLRAIRKQALTQSAAAWMAEKALHRLIEESRLEVGARVEQVLLAHRRQLREDCLRWRSLAEHAALYLEYPDLAGRRARGWWGECLAKGELPGRPAV